MNLSHAVRTAKSIITANSPVLLVGTAVAGVVSTGILAARGGYKARGILDAAEAERAMKSEPPLDLQEKVKLTWLCYAGPAATGVSTIIAVSGVHLIHTKRHKELAALYAVASTRLDDYRAKAEQMLGPKKTQDLQNELAQEELDRNPLNDNRQVIILGGGQEICYDSWSDRYFTGSQPIIDKAFNEVNLALAEYGECSLNEFYDYVGLPTIPYGDDFGWSGGGKLEPTFGGAMTPDGRAAICFGFKREPKDRLGKGSKR